MNADKHAIREFGFPSAFIRVHLRPSAFRLLPDFMTSSWLTEYSQDVEERTDMLLAVEKILAPAPGYPARPRAEEAQRLSIAVISTSIESTIAAMKKAGAFASSLGARITLVVPQVVPFPLPLESPPV